MDGSFQQGIPDSFPLGLGYLRLIADSRNEAEDCIFLDVNREFEKLTDLHRDEILGKRASEVFRNRDYGSCGLISYCGSVVRTGKTQETTQWIEDIRRCLKLIVIPLEHDFFVAAVRDVSGEEASYEEEKTELYPKEMPYLPSSVKDSSELEKERNEKETLAQRLRSMFYRHTVAMLMIDLISGRIVEANPAACFFYGYSKEEMQSLLISDINNLPPEEVDRYQMMSYKEEQRFFIFPHRLKNGMIRLVEVYSCPISDGKNALLCSIIFDVTDRDA